MHWGGQKGVTWKVGLTSWIEFQEKIGCILTPRTSACDLRDFPCDSVVKNPPDSAGDAGSIPDLGRPYMSCSNKAHVPHLLSQRSRACAAQQGKPLQWKSVHLSWRGDPAHCNQRKPVSSNSDPVQPEVNNFKKNVTLFGNRVVADKYSLKWGHDGVGGTLNSIRPMSLNKEKRIGADTEENIMSHQKLQVLAEQATPRIDGLYRKLGRGMKALP